MERNLMMSADVYSYPVASRAVRHSTRRLFTSLQGLYHSVAKPPASWPSLPFFASASEAHDKSASSSLDLSRARRQPRYSASRGPMDSRHGLVLMLVMFPLLLLSPSCQAATTTGAAAIVLLPSVLNQSSSANSSDLAQRFYQRYTRGDTVESFNSSTVARLPAMISRRLARLNVSVSAFTLLPGLLQQAVVWDSGFVLDAKSSSMFVQVWTSQGRSMADIVVSRQEIVENTGSQCPLTQCSQSNSSDAAVTSYKTTECSCDTLVRVSKCAIPADTDFDDPALSSSALLWASGVDPNAVPVPRIAEHRCLAASNGNSTAATVVSIHTSANIDTLVGCSSTQFDSLVIPCVRISTLNSTLQARMKEPRPSAWVDTWLTASVPLIENREASTGLSTPSPPSSSSESPETQHSFKIVLLIPIVMGSLVAIALVGLVAIRHTGPQHQKSDRGVTTNSSIDVSALLSPRSKDYS